MNSTTHAHPEINFEATAIMEGGAYTRFTSLAQLHEVLTVEEESEALEKYAEAQDYSARYLAVLVFPLEDYLQVCDKAQREDGSSDRGRISEITAKHAEHLMGLCREAREASGRNKVTAIENLSKAIAHLDYRHISAVADCAMGDIPAGRLCGMSVDEAHSVVDLLKSEIQNANLQQDILFKHNLRLFIKIAHEHCRSGHMKQHRDDLMQVGALGLLAAIQKYTRGQRTDGGDNRLSGWATWWIKHYIRRWIDKSGHAIKRPVRKSERQRKLYKDLLHIVPQVEMDDLAAMSKVDLMRLILAMAGVTSYGEALQLDQRKVQSMHDTLAKRRGNHISLAEILELRVMPTTSSYNVPIGGDGERDGGMELGDVLSDERGEWGYAGEEAIDRNVQIASINSEVANLDVVSQVGLTLLFGMGSAQEACWQYSEQLLEDFRNKNESLQVKIAADGANAPTPASFYLLGRLVPTAAGGWKKETLVDNDDLDDAANQLKKAACK